VGGAHYEGAQGRKCSHPSVPKLVSFESFAKFCSVIECQILNEILDQLAPKYPEVKFVRAVATKCVEGMLDRDLPALLFYKNEDLIGNIIPAREVLGGKRMTVKTVEFVLSINRILDIEFEHDPRDKLKLINTIIKKGKDAGRHHEDDVDSEGDDDREYVSNQY